MIPLLVAASTSIWVYLGPILAGVGGITAASAALWAQRNKSKTDRVDYHNSLLESMQSYLNYMGAENGSLRQRLDDLTTQVQRCQNDKYEMQVKLADWERKWEGKIGGTNPAT